MQSLRYCQALIDQVYYNGNDPCGYVCSHVATRTVQDSGLTWWMCDSCFALLQTARTRVSFISSEVPEGRSNMPTIQCLGTGSAFTLKNYQTNFLLTAENGYRLLVDCGSDCRRALAAHTDLTYLDIDGVYVSHLHADHIGGLEWLAFATHFDPRRQDKPDLWISRFLVDDLWNRSLSGGLASIQNETNTLETYFRVQAQAKNGGFCLGNTYITLVQTIHVMNGFSLEPSYGLMVGTLSGPRIFLTTDTQHCPSQIMDFYKSADVIIHDAECTPYKSGVHAHFDDLASLPPEIKAKIWLVHFQDDVLNNWSEQQDKAHAAGFHGFLEPGAELSY
jgi:ribonuclease BN (tRNA processing enzyme)